MMENDDDEAKIHWKYKNRRYKRNEIFKVKRKCSTIPLVLTSISYDFQLLFPEIYKVRKDGI